MSFKAHGRSLAPNGKPTAHARPHRRHNSIYVAHLLLLAAAPATFTHYKIEPALTAVGGFTLAAAAFAVFWRRWFSRGANRRSYPEPRPGTGPVADSPAPNRPVNGCLVPPRLTPKARRSSGHFFVSNYRRVPVQACPSRPSLQHREWMFRSPTFLTWLRPARPVFHPGR